MSCCGAAFHDWCERKCCHNKYKRIEKVGDDDRGTNNEMVSEPKAVNRIFFITALHVPANLRSKELDGTKIYSIHVSKNPIENSRFQK